MRGDVALARRNAPFAPKSSPDEMMLGEKTLKVFLCSADVAHGFLRFRSWFNVPGLLLFNVQRSHVPTLNRAEGAALNFER
jgi:hypothetical protein